MSRPPHGLTITIDNLILCYPYGVPGGETAEQIAEKLAGRKLARVPERYIRRINRLVPSSPSTGD